MIRRPRENRPRSGLAGFAVGLGLLLAASGARTGEDELEFVRIDHPSLDELEGESFRLQRPLGVRVHCEGAGEPKGEMYAYGWILNLRTRKVEWALRAEDSQRGSGDNWIFDGDVRLPAGEFTAYFAPFTQPYRIIRLFDKEIARIRIQSDRHKNPRSSKRWQLVLSAPSAADREAVESLDPPVDVDDPRRFVEIIRTGDEASEARGFTLPAKMSIEVYCEGEFVDPSQGPVDVGWILNADTRQRVWEFGPDNFQSGGGSFKNKMSRETITLPAGNYIARYVTDGSHSYAGWNDPPPYDPDGWGMILWAPSATDARRIRPYVESEDDPKRTVIALIRQGDGAFVNQGFTLKRDARVRVYALGEYSEGSEEFVDQGWIEAFASGRMIWSMVKRNTHPAGGAAKNRMADEVIDLQRGDYVAYYSTDDTHSYPGWNATPPGDPEHWGITIAGVDADFGPGAFALFDPAVREEQGRDFLVRLVRVGNDEHRRQRFRLDKATRLRIVAVGEGAFGQMVDYGWIEDTRNGTWVWEMTIRNTRPAGGAEKNRRFDGTILLDAGDYEAHFVTDDSHAWNAWNRTRPDDPNAWGLTITRADSK